MNKNLFNFGELIPMGSISIPSHCFIIAEIGINHNGDMDLTKQLIDKAKECGADAVKFQKRTIDVVYSDDVLNAPRESPWGTTQRQQKEGLEFGKEEYDKIDAYCKTVGIIWFASAWDLKSQEFLKRYSCPFNKIASAMIVHNELIEMVAEEGKPTFISTGMCTYEDIDRAVEVFKRHECPYTLMHCVSTYPSPEDDLNLHMIVKLRDRYQCPVGYSGHEASVSPSVMAAALGATVIERHITLDRAMYGSDQAASLEESGLETLIAQIRKLPKVLGNGEKTISKGESAVAKKLRYWTEM